MLRRALAGMVPPGAFEAAAVQSGQPGREPRPLRLGPSGRRRRESCRRWVTAWSVVDAAGQADAFPAHHRRADRRLPPARRRDGHPRPVRPARDRPGRRAGDRAGRRAGAGGAGAGGAGAGVPAGDDNLVRRALAAAGRQAFVRLYKRIPAGAGLGGGSADAAAVLRWAGVTDLTVAARLGADVPFCLIGGRARVRGVGEQVEPLPVRRRRRRAVTPCSPRRSECQPRWCTGRGTAWVAAEPTAPTTWRPPPWRLSPAWPPGATASARPREHNPRWRAAGPPGSFRGAFPGDGRIVRSGVRPAPDASRPRPALPARRLQHLLVLLLAHPLPPLLDQRSHGGSPT